MRYSFLAGLVVLCLGAGQARANLIVNGDFEDNSAGGTLFNLPNAAFNATMANATAFGGSEEIDIITGAPFGLPPVSGQWKLAIHARNDGLVDAFSFDLSSPIVAGQAYDLDFYAQAVTDFDPNVGPVEVGISSDPTSFGTLVFSGLPGTADWTHLVTNFVAPVSGSYLTVRNSPSVLSSWVHIDDFTLTLVPEPASLALCGLGGVLLFGVARRRRAA